MRRLTNLLPWRRRRLERELERELADHVDRRADELRREGLDNSSAQRQARIELGGLPQTQEYVRDTWTWQWLETLGRDTAFALRTLKRTPGFAMAAALSLALAIGANTAIFSVVRGILLKPLPYPAPAQLVMVWQDMRARGGPIDEWATPGNLADWRAESRIFSTMASIRGWAPTLTGMGDAAMLAGEQVTQAYFDVLGIQPATGRAFLPEEAVPNAARVVIVSHRFWQQRLGGASDVLGKRLLLSGEPHEIVGVMPPDFRPIVNQNADVWRPDRLNLANPSRGAIVLRIVARLQPAMSIDDARTAMTVVAEDLGRRFPQTSGNVGINVVPLHEQVVGDARPGMLMLMGAVALVVLIACVNIANLLLARAPRRFREIAVRLALGASRGRVVRQLLTESVLLAVLGGGVGILLSFWGMKALVAVAPAGTPRLSEVSLDSTVLLVSAGLTVLTGFLFGLVPAAQLTRRSHSETLNEGSRGMTGGATQRLRRGLVIAEIAIALMLLVGGGLLIRTFAALQRADLGFEPAGVVGGFIPVPPNHFGSPAEAIAFEDRLLERVAAISGVTRAAWTSILPLGPGGDNDMDFTIEGMAPPPPDQPGPVVWYRVVSADYLQLMGVRLRSGRLFSGREPQPSVVIGQTLASRYWPGVDPVGRRVRFGPPDGASPWFTIAGVVDDISQRGARGAARGQIFIPYWHAGPLALTGLNVVVRTDASPDAASLALQEAIRDLDPALPIANVAPMTALIARSVDEPRFLAAIAGLFAVLSMLLAAVGVYGVMAYAVTARQQEISVRLALGATRRDILGLTFGDGLRLMATGIVVGAIGAAAVAPALKALLYGLEPLDALTFAGTCGVVLATSGLAVLIPASRASRVNAAATLRH